MTFSCYCSIADAKQENLAENTVDDDRLLRLIRQFTSRINTKFKAFGTSLFVPVIDTRSIGLYPGNISSWNRTLTLSTYGAGVSPLLELTAVSSNSQSLVIGTNVQTYPAAPAPWYALQLMGSAWTSWYNAACNPSTWGIQNATVTGVWGYNTDYAHAWLDVDTLAAAILNTTATTFTVANVDGDNPLGESPRISAGNVVQIEDEWMDVVATDITTNTVTVVRGVNGSTAAAHVIGSIVSVYQVDENIRRATARQAAFLYSRQGAFDTARIDGVGVVQYPQDMPQEISALLSLFANM